jgi:DNA invertase Pin-like site-specific DNA recombinase
LPVPCCARGGASPTASPTGRCRRPASTVCLRNSCKFTIHILAAVAEHERDAISARTKAALAAAKAKGKVLGKYQRIASAKQRATTVRAERLRPLMTELANLSTRAAADALNRRGIKTASGGQWFPMQVHRARHRLDL